VGTGVCIVGGSPAEKQLATPRAAKATWIDGGRHEGDDPGAANPPSKAPGHVVKCPIREQDQDQDGDPGKNGPGRMDREEWIVFGAGLQGTEIRIWRTLWIKLLPDRMLARG
jgi:hypothetical protein